MSSFTDYLQELADHKRAATIKFRSVEGAVSIIKAHVVSFDNEGGRDIITTDAGFSIGVDQIIEVNGRLGENYC